MAGLADKKMEGSTLVEVLIALVIIMAVFTIASAVFSNVINGGISMRQIRINAQMEKLRLHFLDSTAVDQQSLTVDSVEYHVTFTDSVSAGITQVEINAIDQGKSSGKIKFLTALNHDKKED